MRGIALSAAAVLVAIAVPLLAQKVTPFEVEEATIAQVHDAMKAGHLTCLAFVRQCLKRIEAYDKSGPMLNTVQTIRPSARNAYQDSSNSHMGPPTSASSVVTGS